MPVPLLLSDLPPTVEQSEGSTPGEFGERVPAISVPWEIDSTPKPLPWAEVSSLAGVSMPSAEPVPGKPLQSVLPSWLVGAENAAAGQYSHSTPAKPEARVVPGAALMPASSPRAEATAELSVEQVQSLDPEEFPEPLDSGVTGEDNPPAPNLEEVSGPSVPEASEETTPEPPGVREVADLVLRANQQSYNPVQQTITASGDVLVQFGDAQLAAERLWVNLDNRFLRAEGDVFFNRNDQILQGETATYNLLQGSGEITNGRGELSISTLEQDLTSLPLANEPLGNVPIEYRLQQEGTISSVTSPGGVTFGTESRQIFGGESGTVRRLRFESDTIYFDADGWYAEELRITNDPFSPPELELRGSSVRLTPLNADQTELYIENPRLVFDQGLSLPLFKERYILQQGQLDSNQLNPLPTSIGIDGRDRDGLFVGREFSVTPQGPLSFTVVPQFYIGRWLGESDSNLFDPANFGVVARVSGNFGPRTTATGTMSLPGLDLENFTDRLRARLQAQHLIGDHILSVEYTYRDRLYNGSLGFQDVQNSLGLLLQSPTITLGDTKINLRYQASGQYVTADTDDPDLLAVGESQGLASLLRFQGAVDLDRSFSLWQGTPLPATPAEGLRYSPRPLVPFLALVTGLRGVATYYSNSALQDSLEARVTLVGQLGHLQRNYLDYTQFNLGYSTSLVGGDGSPFFFDRNVDTNVLSAGILQQVYGPFLAGFQTSINLETGEEIDTDVLVEYRRRAYGLLFQYSPTRETGFLGFRISDFDWTGRTLPFDADNITAPVGEDGPMVR